MRVERQHSDFRVVEGEVLLERTVEDFQLLDEGLRGEVSGHFFDGHVVGGEPDTQVLGHHQHQRRKLLAAEIVFEESGVPGEFELFGLNVVFVDRRGHDGVDQLVFQVAAGGVEGTFRHLAGDFRGGTEVDLHLLFIEVDEVGTFGGELFRRFGVLEREVRHLHIFFMVRCHFRESVNHGGAHFHDSVVAQRLDNHFVADAVDVALRDAYYKILILSHSSIFKVAKIKKM